MVKKCIYCYKELDQDSIVDVCNICGVGVWGKTMFEAIKQNMQNAKAKGDLYQGSVTDSL